MQDELARRGSGAGKAVQLISVSVDPLNDTPEELAKYARKFDAVPGWTLVTGSRKSIDAIVRAFGVGGASYFTNLPVVSQDRVRLRFYADLVRGKNVLINSFYASCRDVCPPVSFNLAKAQKLLDEQIRSPVQILSISTDPVADAPELQRDYAARHAARPGWSFMTGKKENVDWVLHKLGLYNEDKTQHSAILWIGNERSGAWLKLHALAPPEDIVAAVRKIQ